MILTKTIVFTLFILSATIAVALFRLNRFILNTHIDYCNYYGSDRCPCDEKKELFKRNHKINIFTGIFMVLNLMITVYTITGRLVDVDKWYTLVSLIAYFLVVSVFIRKVRSLEESIP